MAFDFPSSPSVGQLYPTPAVAGVPQYRWSGQAWVQSTAAAVFQDAPSDGKLYGRQNAIWTEAVNKLGDTMTGSLAINAAGAYLTLNKAASTQESAVIGQKAGVTRWLMSLGNTTA